MSEPSKLQIKFMGISVSAEGAVGIGAAVLIFFGTLLYRHFS